MARRVDVSLANQSSHLRLDNYVSHKGGIIFQWEAMVPVNS
jgi:hypothetical protein